jgi:hypothetical protein
MSKKEGKTICIDVFCISDGYAKTSGIFSLLVIVLVYLTIQ